MSTYYAIKLPEGKFWTNDGGSYSAITIFYEKDQAKRACSSVNAARKRRQGYGGAFTQAYAGKGVVVPVTMQETCED